MRTKASDSAPLEMEPISGIVLSELYCVWLKDEKTLVAADLHLGMEGVAAAEGAYFPKRQKPVIHKRLEAMLRRYRPELFVIAGDFKHNFGPNLVQEWNEVEFIYDFLSSRTEVALVRGNHDNYLKSIIADAPLPEYLKVGEVLVSHGHRNSSELAKWTGPRLIAHEHPSLKLQDTVGARVVAPAFLIDDATRTVVLPALSPLAAGSDVLMNGPISPILRELNHRSLRAIALSMPGLLDFGNLGTLESRRA
jgi:putative SbcD/Mre11-related phosphoesterase